MHYGNFSIDENPTTTPIDQASFPDWNGCGGTTSHTLGGNPSPMPEQRGAHGEMVWQKLD
jgi:hypothetical protein